ncbi:MAG: hypothetical protein RJB58_2333 [Pseudomonadota bacterium]|jgi:TctA family transporter
MRKGNAAMLALLGNTGRGMGQVALATAAAASLIAVCAAALVVTLVCAAPLRLLQAR